MRITNLLPLQLKCIQSWTKQPTLEQFRDEFYSQVRPQFEAAFGTVDVVFEHIRSIPFPWETYRKQALELDSNREIRRLQSHLERVQDFFKVKLEGEIVLFVMFSHMDGYARFDEGTHRVFIGLTSHNTAGPYYDILETHELTHVARESRPYTWTSWGLNPKATHDEFVEQQPILEHLFGEGFSCAISEVLNPGKSPWGYVYQSEKDLALILKNGESVSRVIHEELKKDEMVPSEADYHRLYQSSSYQPPLPIFAHYVWAWSWVKSLLKIKTPEELLSISSKDLRESALAFRL